VTAVIAWPPACSVRKAASAVTSGSSGMGPVCRTVPGIALIDRVAGFGPPSARPRAETGKSAPGSRAWRPDRREMQGGGGCPTLLGMTDSQTNSATR